jgi:proline iminopeptidase
VRVWIARVAGAVAALLVPLLAAAVAFSTVASSVTLVVPAVLCALVLAGALLACFRDGPRPAWLAGVVFGAALSLVWWTAAAIPVGQVRQSRPPDLQTWHLRTGSTIGYLREPASGSQSAGSPVVILHGGPGVGQVEALRRFAESLDLEGRAVYVYDEAGVGASSRLDPRRYGVRRDVEDLEAIRETIGASRMVLIGHSYGAYLAATYAGSHPDRVERMVLASPGPMDSEDHSPSNLFSRFSGGDRWRVFGYALRPRPLVTYLMSLADPTKARRVVPDAEADTMSDQLVGRSTPALYCTPPASHPELETGNYRMQTHPLPPSTQESAALRGALARVQAETLILKGSCDYLSWDSAMDYWRLLDHARICYVEGAGHNLLEERADYVPGLIRRFVTTGETCRDDAAPVAPESYQGEAG